MQDPHKIREMSKSCVGRASLQTLQLLCRALSSVERRLCSAGVSAGVVAASTVKLRRRILEVHGVCVGALGSRCPRVVRDCGTVTESGSGCVPTDFCISPNVFSYATKAALQKLGLLCNLGKAYIVSDRYCDLDLSDACAAPRPAATVQPRPGRPMVLLQGCEGSEDSPRSSASSTVSRWEECRS